MRRQAPIANDPSCDARPRPPKAIAAGAAARRTPAATLAPMKSDLTMGEAAKAIGVSVDTLRRWDKAGKLRTRRDANNRRVVSSREVSRLTQRPSRHETGAQISARNRFPGVISSVEIDGVMALVEIEAGDFAVTAAITRDSALELNLTPGMNAVATVKATSVMIEAARD